MKTNVVLTEAQKRDLEEWCASEERDRADSSRPKIDAGTEAYFERVERKRKLAAAVWRAIHGDETADEYLAKVRDE